MADEEQVKMLKQGVVGTKYFRRGLSGSFICIMISLDQSQMQSVLLTTNHSEHLVNPSSLRCRRSS
jgi:hypothetical protein